MSGIAGILLLDRGEVDPADVRRSVDAMARRGPDGLGVWCSGSIGFGHAALWTTTESVAERLPLVDDAGALAITADARLDNRDELFALLNLGPFRREIGDGDLILRAFSRWGESCVDRLTGDFAFAVWDAKTRTLFCARDRFGLKPFFYYRSERVFAFASEIKGLFAAASPPRRINETAVADYLLSILDDRESTFYEAVRRMPAAHRMTVDRDGVRLRRYWSLDADVEIEYGSDDEYAEAFREKFADAVRGCLRSAFPIGATLSGGLDSSAIVGMTRQIHPPGSATALHTFSAIFPDVPECDERPFVDAVVARNGTHAHAIRCDATSPLAGCEETLEQQDEPYSAPNLFMYQAVCREAAQLGVRVMLDGIDGDTAVSHGLARLTELAAACKWPTLVREAAGLARQFGRPCSHWLWTYGVRPLLPPTGIRTLWRRARRQRDHWLPAASPPIRMDFARRTDIAERIAQIESGRAPRTARDDHRRRAIAGGFQRLFEVADRTAAGVRIESRHPFFDHRLVQFCVALPADQKLKNGWTRLIMRRALAEVLPETIRWRPGKTRLGANFARSLLGFERASLQSPALALTARIHPYVDPERFRSLADRFTAQHDPADAFAIWKTLLLSKWLESSGVAP